ncbi:hypothetical protein MMC29_005868 [Sticta canariensis]|nr:hypothetical protein [Sticta canariensis]
MVSHNSQDGNPQNDDDSHDGPGNNPEKKPQNDPQDDLQDDLQNRDAIVVFDPPGQSISDFERSFSTSYSIQSSLLSNLNRLDFKHLQLAGIRTPVGRGMRRKYLVPSRCDEMIPTRPGSTNLVRCPNTSRTMDEIKTCHGTHHDGWGPRGRAEKWIEPRAVFKHVPDADVVQLPATDHGHFDSFNVCIECHERDRHRRRAVEDLSIVSFHSNMCQPHCLEYIRQQPYNACRCRRFIEKYWRCNLCSLDTMNELKLRAQTFGDILEPVFTFDDSQSCYVDRRTQLTRSNDGCPILGCARPRWRSYAFDQQMFLCRACTAIFPAFQGI